MCCCPRTAYPLTFILLKPQQHLWPFPTSLFASSLYPSVQLHHPTFFASSSPSALHGNPRTYTGRLQFSPFLLLTTLLALSSPSSPSHTPRQTRSPHHGQLNCRPTPNGHSFAALPCRPPTNGSTSSAAATQCIPSPTRRNSHQWTPSTPWDPFPLAPMPYFLLPPSFPFHPTTQLLFPTLPAILYCHPQWWFYLPLPNQPPCPQPPFSTSSNALLLATPVLPFPPHHPTPFSHPTPDPLLPLTVVVSSTPSHPASLYCHTPRHSPSSSPHTPSPPTTHLSQPKLLSSSTPCRSPHPSNLAL
ncbi:hypothetical protein AMTRI_Chr12g234830 [Amborella trichopoda]